MAIIKSEDFIRSIEESLQYISYYHPLDFVEAMHRAYQKEEKSGGKGCYRPDPD